MQIIRPVGQTIQLDCIAYNSVMWGFNGGLLPQNAQEDQVFDGSKILHKLTITNMQLENSGKYTCFGKGSGWLTVTRKSVAATVQIFHLKCIE